MTNLQGLDDERIRLYTDVENVIASPSLYSDAVSMACEIRSLREVLKALDKQRVTPEPPAERQLDTVGGIERFPRANWGRTALGLLDTDDSRRLDRCPFCGHEAAFREKPKAGVDDRHTISVECSNGSCAIRTPDHYASRDAATVAWNRRALNRRSDP